uniref:Uncharacterized protein n=1 Tax=Shewanella putrefaciens (strain 200) TaxID=399804 RepID=E6XSA5_SHEP2
MPKEFKAFIVSALILLILMYFYNESFEIADSPVSVIILLVAFGLTYAWVKNEFFPSKRDDE